MKRNKKNIFANLWLSLPYSIANDITKYKKTQKAEFVEGHV